MVKYKLLNGLTSAFFLETLPDSFITIVFLTCSKGLDEAFFQPDHLPNCLRSARHLGEVGIFRDGTDNIQSIAAFLSISREGGGGCSFLDLKT